MSGYVNVRDPADAPDWVPAFQAAISEARLHNRRGVFVPADQDDYTVNLVDRTPTGVVVAYDPRWWQGRRLG